MVILTQKEKTIFVVCREREQRLKKKAKRREDKKKERRTLE